MFEFASPWLLLCLPLPLLAYFFLPSQKQQDSAILVPFFNQVSDQSNQSSGYNAQKWLLQIVAALAWILLVVAAARPQWVGESIQLPTEGRDLLLAVDISGSMETADMTIDNKQLRRIDAVKFVVGDFVERRENDRLGLILFGSQAYLQAPLTFDRATVGKLLQEAELGFAGQKTAIGDAIGLAIKRLRDRPAKSRVLILLTDGANTAGEVDPKQAADLAAIAGIKIYTVGVGADEMVQETFFGRRRVNPSADLDETTLSYIAEQTGGRYFRAKGPEDLIRIYQKLDELEPIEQNDEVYRPTHPLFFWPLSISMLLSFALAGNFIAWRDLTDKESTRSFEQEVQK